MHHRLRQFFAVFAIFLWIATLAAWAQSYYGGQTFCAYKNHNSFNFTSLDGGICVLWYRGYGGATSDAANTRRWEFLRWTPVSHDTESLFSSSLSPLEAAQNVAYSWAEAWHGQPGYFSPRYFELAGVLLAYANPPPPFSSLSYPYLVVSVPYWIIATLVFFATVRPVRLLHNFAA